MDDRDSVFYTYIPIRDELLEALRPIKGEHNTYQELFAKIVVYILNAHEIPIPEMREDTFN